MRFGGLRKLATYAGSTALLGITSVVSVPAILIGVGEEAWSHYVIAQAVGAAVGLVVVFGWTISGPASLAGRTVQQQHEELSASATLRTILFVIVAPAGAAVTVTLTGGSLAAALLSTALGVYGLTFGWYFVGVHDAVGLFVNDAVPRAAGVLVGCLLAAVVGDLLWYAVPVLFGAMTAFLLPAFRLGVRYSWSRHEVVSRLRMHLPAALASALSLVYLSLPALTVAALTPSSVARFGLADRILKLGTAASQPVAQFNQGAISTGTRDGLTERIRVASVRTMFAAVGVCAVAIALVPLAGSLLSGGRLSLGLDYSIPVGIVLFATILSQLAGTACLPALGVRGAITISATAGAIVCVGLLATAVPKFGGVAAMWSVACAELVVLAVQSAWLCVVIRRRRMLGDG